MNHGTSLTHASFFSGGGGVDMGLERAGWRTVSVSEIDPYANALLAQRWPDAPNLGDIVALAEHGTLDPGHDADDWRAATLWTGGFPCQDLSLAGKRRGLAGARSGLAYAFLDLVERHRPAAVVLENVPGLLSSHRGRDMAALCGAMVQLGYGVAYRTLNARYFGVPQRRRRVFILALREHRGDADGRAAALSAAEILSVATRCPRHPPTGGEQGPGAADAAGDGAPLHGLVGIGATTTRTVQAGWGGHGYRYPAQDLDAGWLQLAPALTTRQERNQLPDQQQYVVPPITASMAKGVGHNKDEFIVTARAIHTSTGRRSGPSGDEGGNLIIQPAGQAADADGVRAPDGLARRLDGGGGVAAPLLSNSGGTRTTDLNTPLVLAGEPMIDDLHPSALDTHRYRVCGNGVVAPVAEWLGHRLRLYFEGQLESQP